MKHTVNKSLKWNSVPSWAITLTLAVYRRTWLLWILEAPLLLSLSQCSRVLCANRKWYLHLPLCAPLVLKLQLLFYYIKLKFSFCINWFFLQRYSWLYLQFKQAGSSAAANVASLLGGISLRSLSSLGHWCST